VLLKPNSVFGLKILKPQRSQLWALNIGSTALGETKGFFVCGGQSHPLCVNITGLLLRTAVTLQK